MNVGTCVKERINHMHCRYRVMGGDAMIGNVAARLDSIARNELSAAFTESMQKTMPVDKRVFVLKKLDAIVNLDVDKGASDQKLARQWADCLVRIATSAVMQNRIHQADMKIYDDQAAYVAAYITHQVEPRVSPASSCWCFSGFSHLAGQERSTAILNALLENRFDIPKVMTLLHRTGRLMRVVDVLGPKNLMTIWIQVVQSPSRQSTRRLQDGSETANRHDGSRVESFSMCTDGIEQPTKDKDLFAQAWMLIDRLSLWRKPPLAKEALFESYRPSSLVDWSDRESLSVAVCDVLRFFEHTGYLKKLSKQNVLSGLARRVTQVMKKYDWLDKKRLENELFMLVTKNHPSLPQRTRSDATPKQKRLLFDLAGLDKGIVTRYVPAQDFHALALGMYAALVDRAPGWAGSHLAAKVVEGYAKCLHVVRRSSHPFAVLHQIEQGRLEDACGMLPPDQRVRLVEGFEVVNALEDGVELLGSWLRPRMPKPVGSDEYFDTDCAGVFLLLRTLNDLGIVELAQKLAYPTDGIVEDSGLLTVPLISRLSGLDPQKGRIDRGILILSSSPQSESLESLAQIWKRVSDEEHRCFQQAFVKTLVGRRLVKSKEVHIYNLEAKDWDGRYGIGCLVAGGSKEAVWPFGALLETPARAEQHIGLCIQAWRQAGIDIDRLIIDESLIEGFHALDCPINMVSVPKVGRWRTDVDTISDNHNQGKRAVQLTLSAFEHGVLGAENPDLVLGLLANTVVRAWAGWLRGFSSSGSAYLLDNALRRKGRIHCNPGYWEIEMEPRPLDVVVRMAGYCNVLERVSWLGGKSLRYGIMEPA